jgi:glycosyltransferase involved in cell wall biosynthesis
MRVAVVHDGTINPGGAVRVVTEATKALDADLYVGFSGKKQEWWQERVPNDVSILRRTSRSGRLNDIRTAHSILNLELHNYDVLFTSGPAAKFVQPYDDQLRIHYLHHPPLAALWFEGGLLSYLVKSLDRLETLTIPAVIANSELTAIRAERHYGESVDEVICPPVDIKCFNASRDRQANQLVLVGRLEERKRPKVAIDAMRELPEYTLKVLGDGPLRGTLERNAPENVEFEGYVDDETLRRTVEQSVAGLFLAEREDFGITPIEYMAAGTPVVGVDEPNTSNQVDQQTGVLVDPTPDAVAEGVRRVEKTTWDHAAIRESAKAFSTDRFREKVERFVEAEYF